LLALIIFVFLYKALTNHLSKLIRE
jgi:uncharacterized membrane protein YjfL (UPF0719 family)